MIQEDRTVRTTCPYCGVGCQLNLKVKDDYIYAVEAPFDAAPNYGMLCVKGRFGTDYVKHPGRVKKPLIRTNRAEGRSATPVWREASWDEALDYVADELTRITKNNGGDAIATYASAKATNEDNYLFQKLDPRPDRHQQCGPLCPPLPRRFCDRPTVVNRFQCDV